MSYQTITEEAYIVVTTNGEIEDFYSERELKVFDTINCAVEYMREKYNNDLEFVIIPVVKTRIILKDYIKYKTAFDPEVPF